MTGFVVMVPLAVWKAHSHQVAAHRADHDLAVRRALLIAGLLTLAPGRSCSR